MKLPALLAAATAILLYLPTLGHSYTYDDVHLITHPDEVETRSLGAVWGSSYWGEALRGLYRPVTSTTFWVEGRLHLPFAARHGLNVALHAAVAALMAALAWSLGLGRLGAAVAGILFAAHPVHVEAVAGLVGRAEILAAFWVLVAVRVHDAAHARRGGLVRPALALAALGFLASGSKEWAWSLPALLAAVDLARGRRVAAGLPLWVAAAAGVGAHLVVRRAVLGGWLNTPEAMIPVMDNPLVALEGGERLRAGLAVAGRNLAQLVYPPVLSPDYTGAVIPLPGSWGWTAAGIALLTGAAAVLAAGKRLERPAWTVAGAWLLLGAFLQMNLTVTLGTIMADRLLYWPSAAWVMIVAGGLSLAARGGRIRVAVAVGVLLTGAYAARTLGYVPHWKDDAALFGEATTATPGSQRAWYNLGRIRQQEGALEEARACFQEAARIDPEFGEAWLHLATTLMLEERWDEASGAMERAEAVIPGHVLVHLNRGVIQLHRGDPAGAAIRFERVLQAEPGRPEALYNLALALTRLERFADAAGTYERLLEGSPENAAAMNNLAWILAVDLGRREEGERWARRAVEGDPASAVNLDTLAEILFRGGDRAGALEAARRVLDLDGSARYREQLVRFENDPVPAPGP